MLAMILLQAAASAAAFAKVGACLEPVLPLSEPVLVLEKSVLRPWSLSLVSPSRRMTSVPT